ncbi:MAG: toxin-antitoxin system HicB family antitoxin [Thermodesulfobacteriota bacterium]
MMNKTATDYLKEPYSRILIPVDGTYSAKVLEFHGCFAQGNTPEEAYTNLEKAAESWIEVAISRGQEIPPPIASHDFSGRIALRIPRSIHKQAAKFAEMDDTSLNQFFLTAIAARVGAEEFYERLCSKLEARCMTFSKGISSAIDLPNSLWSTSSVVNIISISAGQSPIPWSFGGQPLITLRGLINQEGDLNG